MRTERTQSRGLAARLCQPSSAGELSSGDENYCFLAYTSLTGHDDATWSFAVLARFNTDRPEGLAACNAVLATRYVRTPINPSNVWAS